MRIFPQHFAFSKQAKPLFVDSEISRINQIALARRLRLMGERSAL